MLMNSEKANFYWKANEIDIEISGNLHFQIWDSLIFWNFVQGVKC